MRPVVEWTAMPTTEQALVAADNAIRVRKDAQGDAAPLVFAIRGGRLVALVESADLSDLLRQLPLAAAGFGADALVLAVEGVAPMTETNPLTGAPWQRCEAEQVRVDHDGIAEGWVRELVIVVSVVRDGTRTTAYTLEECDGELRWDADAYAPGPVGVEPVLERALQQPAADPATVRDPGDAMVAAADAPFLSPERGRLTLDIGCTRVIDRQLGEQGRAALIAEDDAAEALYRSEGLDPWQVVR